ncbi:hypothetical protein KKH82_05445, partial [Patescibacteria group bacterium]|nr:hypothetical protein [Patescibacteria group bacterium]
SVNSIHAPLSSTLIKDFPHSLITTLIEVAQASKLFSTNSLTTEAGLSITSQALSVQIIYSGNLRIAITY